ncbi:MAG: (2Fe-2S)-binding protein [Thermoactinomyces sp.]|jgi:carbon-monoxide dehydrogenase small subunit
MTLQKQKVDPSPGCFTDTITLHCKVNQEEVSISVPPTRRLLDIIRNDLSLTGTKVSCEIGRCGACTVLMDGQPVNSCLVMAYQADGADIMTIEGLTVANGGKLDPVQQAFLEEGGFQCGYCTPGMILAAKALLDECPQPSDDQILESLSGNLCRCTGYAGILRAVKRAAASIT